MNYSESLQRSTLLMQKMTANAPVVNIYKQWNIVCTDIPFPTIEAKDLPTHDFAGNNGEDTYIPSGIPIKAYDITISFAYKGTLDTAYDNIFGGFIYYLRGELPTDDNYDSITEGGFKIYDRHNKIGRQRAYIKKMDPTMTLAHDTDGDHLTFKITFRVTDPFTDVALTDPEQSVTL